VALYLQRYRLMSHNYLIPSVSNEAVATLRAQSKSGTPGSVRPTL
jgi:hypothetical protein